MQQTGDLCATSRYFSILEHAKKPKLFFVFSLSGGAIYKGNIMVLKSEKTKNVLDF